MISFLYVCVCMCVLFRDRVEVSRDFIVGRCVIVCSMLEDKRYFLFFFNFVKNQSSGSGSRLYERSLNV